MNECISSNFQDLESYKNFVVLYPSVRQRLVLQVLREENSKTLFFLKQKLIEIEYWETGEFRSVQNHKEGKDDGNFIARYPDGRIASQVTFVNGIKEGESRIWYSNGKFWEVSSYVNGKIHGLTIQYYNNGQMRSWGHFLNGLKVGFWRRWYENGQISAQGEYRNDVKIGKWSYWEENSREEIISDETGY